MKKVNKIKSYCNFCKNETQHDILFEHNENWEIEEDIIGNDIYRVIKCQDCGNVSYRTDSSNSDDVEYYDDGSFVPIVQTSYYPPSIIGYGQIKNKYQLPSIVRTIYEETISTIVIIICY